jgi:hypothetical protein
MEKQTIFSMKKRIFLVFALLFFSLFMFNIVSAANLIVFNNTNASHYYFVVNGSTGNVGVGTATPTRALDVRGMANFSGTIWLNNNTDVISNLTVLNNFWNSNTTIWNAINGVNSSSGTNTTATYVPYVGATKNTVLGNLEQCWM